MISRLVLATVVLLVACKKEETAPPDADAAPPEKTEPAEPVEPAEPADAADAPDAAEPAKAEPAKPEPAAGDVIAVVGANAKAKTFAELLAAAEFAKELHSMDGAGYTLLVPTDDAFAKLPKGTVDRWKKNQAELEKLIKFHIVPGRHDVNKLTNFRTAPTALGKELEVKVVQDTDVTIQGAKLVDSDLAAANGYVHLIDKVLQPGKK